METLILLFIYYQHIANIPTTLKIILFFIFTAEVNRYVMLQHEIVMKFLKYQRGWHWSVGCKKF